MEKTVFEQIVAGDAPAEVIYEDDRVMAIMDIFPMNPGHCLVIPRKHAVGLSDLDPRDGARMFEVAQRIAGVLRSVIDQCEGINLSLADGPVAGQEVMHVHLHVLPRMAGDGIRLGRKGKSTDEVRFEPGMEEIANQIRLQLREA